jgi:hypothetical protein
VTPEEVVETVSTKKDFMQFVAILRTDLELSQSIEKERPSSPYGPNALGWENPELSAFLEALHAWADAMDEKLPQEPSWNLFAKMFLAGKGY